MKNDNNALLIVLVAVGVWWFSHPTTVAPVPPKPSPVVPTPIPSPVPAKPVVLMFSGGNCVWCRKFESQVLTNAEVKTALNRFDFRIINTDVDKATAEQYKVRALPTFVRESGAARHEGYMDPKEFIEWLNSNSKTTSVDW